MSLSTTDTFVGTSRRLDGYQYRDSGYPRGTVRVSYKDESGTTHVVNICADGARLLAKALKVNADAIDPPKPRKRRAVAA